MEKSCLDNQQNIFFCVPLKKRKQYAFQTTNLSNWWQDHIWVSCCLKDIAPISWRNKQPRAWYRILKDCQTFMVCHTVRNKQQNQGFDVIEGIHSERRFQTSKHNHPPQKQLTMPSTPLLIAHLLLLINPLSRLLRNLALFHERFPLHLTQPVFL